MKSGGERVTFSPSIGPDGCYVPSIGVGSGSAVVTTNTPGLQCHGVDTYIRILRGANHNFTTINNLITISDNTIGRGYNLAANFFSAYTIDHRFQLPNGMSISGENDDITSPMLRQAVRFMEAVTLMGPARRAPLLTERTPTGVVRYGLINALNSEEPPHDARMIILVNEIIQRLDITDENDARFIPPNRRCMAIQAAGNALRRILGRPGSARVADLRTVPDDFRSLSWDGSTLVRTPLAQYLSIRLAQQISPADISRCVGQGSGSTSGGTINLTPLIGQSPNQQQ